jgi:hypothetical protein
MQFLQRMNVEATERAKQADETNIMVKALVARVKEIECHINPPLSEEEKVAVAAVGRQAAAASGASTIVGVTAAVAVVASDALTTVGATATAAAAVPKIGKSSSRIEAAAKLAQANDTSGSCSGSAGTASGKPAKA